MRLSHSCILVLIPLVIGVTAAQLAQTKSCDDGWVVHDGMCYLMRDEYETIVNAQDSCHVMGSRVAFARKKSTLEFLTKLVSKDVAYGWWYGARYDFNDRVARNMDFKGENSDGTFPSPPLRKLTEAPTTSCVGLSHKSLWGKWNLSLMVDVPCNIQLPFICVAKDLRAIPDKGGSHYVKSDPDVFWFSSKLNRKSYSDAEKACKAMSMTLASIRGTVQMKVVTKELQNRQDNYVDPWWIGLQVTQGQFKWSNGVYMEPSMTKFNLKAKETTHGHNSYRLLLSDGTSVERDYWKSKAPFICMRPQILPGHFGCPHHWLRAGKSCYIPATLNKRPITSAEGEKICAKVGSHLISIDSEIEKLWLKKSLLSKTYLSLFWTSLNDRKNSGTFVWADGSTPKHSLLTWSPGLKGSGECFYMVPNTNNLARSPCQIRVSVGCQYPSTDGTCVSKNWEYLKGHCYYIKDLARERRPYSQQFQCYTDVIKYDKSIVVSHLKVDSQDIVDLYRRAKAAYVWVGLNEKSKGIFTWSVDGSQADLSLFKTSYIEETDNSTSKCGVIDRNGDFEAKSCSTCRCAVGICEKALPGSNRGVVTSSSLVQNLLSTVFIVFVIYRH